MKSEGIGIARTIFDIRVAAGQLVADGLRSAVLLAEWREAHLEAPASSTHENGQPAGVPGTVRPASNRGCGQRWRVTRSPHDLEAAEVASVGVGLQLLL